VDLQAQTGGYLLTPGAFVLDRSGTIRFVYTNNNYSVRVKQNVLLDAARAALQADVAEHFR
jgi:peroxiredoxin